MVKYAWIVLIPFALCVTGCNTFSTIDSPSGDPQTLAAARSCFDLGDFQCASTKYHTLELSTTASSVNQAYSEEAFEILTQNGITFATFMSSVISSGADPGGLVTLLAGALRTNATTNPLSNKTYATRLAIFSAYQKSQSMTAGSNRGIITFITATSLLAEILAEDATGVDITLKQGKLLQSNIVSNPTLCLSSSGLSGCLPPSGATITDGTTAISLPTATTAMLSVAPTLQMVLAAASEMQTGINAISASGGLSLSSASFATSILGRTIGYPTSGSPIFRYGLLSLGIGVKQ